LVSAGNPGGAFVNRSLSVGVLLIAMMPLSAPGQQPNMARLKADAQKVASVIASDQAKTQAFCQMRDLGEQVEQVARENGRNTIEATIQKINDLEKQLGSEYLALIDALNDADPNSKDVQDILSIFDNLDHVSCTH
jgi:hypothetical protein